MQSFSNLLRASFKLKKKSDTGEPFVIKIIWKLKIHVSLCDFSFEREKIKSDKNASFIFPNVIKLRCSKKKKNSK